MSRRISFVVVACWLCAVTAQAADSLEDLQKQLRSDKPGIRQSAADKLGAMGPKAAAAVGRLVDLLDDQPAVRSHAIIALGKIGDKSALPALDFVSRDPLESAGAKKVAHDAIAKLGLLTADEKDWLEDCRKAVVIRGKRIELPKIDLAKRNTPLKSGDFKIGDFGILTNDRAVLQVLNEQDLLLKNSYGPPFFFHGFRTEGVTDDEFWGTKEPVFVIGTATYDDVIGSNRTVRTVIPIRLLKRPMTFEEFKQLRESEK